MTNDSFIPSENWAATVLHTMSEGVLGLDRELRITSANRAAQYLLGWSGEDLIGHKLHPLLQPQRRDGSPYPASESQLSWLEGGGALYCIEDVFWRKDGSPIDFEISALVLPHADGDTHAIVLLRDISVRKESQAALLKAFHDRDKLNQGLELAQGQLMQAEKMASVGQLAAGIAHEINNPIGFVNSNLGTLKTQVDQLLSVLAAYREAEGALRAHPELLAAVERAKASADLDFLLDDMPNLIAESLEGISRVKKIVDNLKDFSRLDTPEWHYANLEKGLESTLNIVWNELKYKVTVVRDYAGLPEIECIASQLNQVFMNLLVNAGHAIAEHGTITLRTRFDETSVGIDIEDTGSGIRPEHMAKIFEPFFTTKPVGQGTGLGLSLAYGIVQQHGGKIEARSEPGQGTVFSIRLPRQRAK